MKLTIKRGDTRNAIVATLLKNGEPVDLTGCHVLFYMRRKVSGGYAVVLPNGKVMYPLEDSAVNETGVFVAEFKVQYPDGRKETFPSENYMQIHITNDLEGGL